MKRFLTVDWDFFIDADWLQRNLMFPDGGNESLPTSIRDYIWDTCYRNPKLINVGVTPDYETYLNICSGLKDCAIMVADSHKHAYNFIMAHTDPDETFEVYNIDFHHDLYCYETRGDKVNCGNWGTLLQEERPNMKYIWVKHKDSDTKDLEERNVEVCTFTLDELVIGIRGDFTVFDAFYLCRSSLWSPPHLDDKFIEGVKLLMKSKTSMLYEKGIDTPREYGVPEDIPLF